MRKKRLVRKVMKILWAIPEELFFAISKDEPAAFLSLFKKRNYDMLSLDPGTKESKAYFAAKAGDGSAARTFITLTDDLSFKRVDVIEP